MTAQQIQEKKLKKGKILDGDTVLSINTAKSSSHLHNCFFGLQLSCYQHLLFELLAFIGLFHL